VSKKKVTTAHSLPYFLVFTMLASRFVRLASAQSTKLTGAMITNRSTSYASNQWLQVVPSASRAFSTVIEAATATDALKYSGYSTIDFTINEDATVYEAVQKFAAFNIGCLVTTDAAGTCFTIDFQK
jgi:uncharacterized cupredoxin-like copper-binding protein